MSRDAAIAIHLVALAAILAAVAFIALRDPASGEVFAAGLLGFVAGILFDRWMIRPVVDWRMAYARR
jgi:hypothetical protein